LDQNSLKTESLSKFQQMVIWALRFYSNSPLPAGRYVFWPLFTGDDSGIKASGQSPTAAV
jgi:hypothetical protein